MTDEKQAGHDDKPEPGAERTVSQQAKQQPKDKPDEGTRPGDLTSENDGGSEG